VRKESCFGEVVRDDEHGLSQRSEQRSELVLQLQPDDRIERSQRLVEEHHVRIEKQRAKERRPLSLTARQLERVTIEQYLRKLHLRRERERPRRDVLLRPSQPACDELRILAHGEVGEKAAVLDDVTDSASHFSEILLGEQPSVEADASCVRSQEAEKHPKESRFPATAGTDECQRFAASDFQRQVAQRGVVVFVPLRDSLCRQHPCGHCTQVSYRSSCRSCRRSDDSQLRFARSPGSNARMAPGG
jgi:hypothetical protein